MNKTNTRRLSIPIVLFFLGLVTIIPFVVLSLFIFPSADDYCFNVKSKELGFFNAQRFWFMNWTGRYFATMILSIQMLVNKLWLYRIIPILFIFGFFSSFYYVIRILLEDIKKMELLYITTACLAVILVQMPSVSQGLYWLPGSVSYQLPNILFLVLLGVIVKEGQRTNLRNSLAIIALIAAIIGCNETSMLYTTLLSLIILAIFVYRKGLRIKRFHWILLLSSIIFSCAVIFAPGNEIRSSVQSGNSDFIFALKNSLKLGAVHIFKWLPLLLILTPFLIGFIIKNNLKIFFKPSTQVLYLLVFFVIISPVIGFFPGFWSLGGPPPLRTINTIYFTFFVGYFGVVLLIVPFISPYARSLDKLLKLKYIFFLFAIVLIAKSRNVEMAYRDLISGDAVNYKMELDDRLKFLNNRSDTSRIILPALNYKPKSIYFDDITDNFEDWRNRCYADYYGLNAVYIRTNE